MITDIEQYTSLPEDVKGAVLALTILIDRIGRLSKADRDDMFELLTEWRQADNAEDRRSIHRAMEEIIAQVPIGTRAMPMPESETIGPNAQEWSNHVARTIRKLREEANMTQADLAARSGLTQSHISRLECAKHTATNFTLEKIAKALGVDVGKIDPCCD